MITIAKDLYDTPHRLLLPGVLSVLLIWALQAPSLAFVEEHIAYTLLGVIGAIFANATGAGGGVVFIPAFEQLNFSSAQAVATSFGIQCMGMTTGAIVWTRFYQAKSRGSEARHWRPFWQVIGLVAPASVAGLWLIYGFNWAAPGSLNALFGWFSILLGSAILLVSLCLKLDTKAPLSELSSIDKAALVGIGFIGGAITAWLSVGVGEILAIYLMLRRFDAIMAVAAAVVVSALTVLCGVLEHLVFNPELYLPVVMFAGPGAVLGAVLARQLASRLPVQKLKLMFSLWVLLMGIGSVLNL